MPRCDYDTIFFRVFCITLLGIAFTFTVILTNVFVDIDGLLYNEEKAKTPKPIVLTTVLADVNPQTKYKETDLELRNHGNGELSRMFIYDKQYDDDNDINADRTKRSLDTKAYKIRVKNPKVKMLLSKQLSSLLEDLEEEEATTTYDTTVMETIKNNLKEVDKIEKEGVLHLAMHNILLKGIINHMDLNDIYKTINDLSTKDAKKIGNKKVTNKPDLDQQLEDAENIENKFLEELTNCSQLRKEVTMVSNARSKNISKNNFIKKEPKILISTLIDIKSVNDVPESEKKKVDTENIVGVVKLLYNGKSVKFVDGNNAKKNISNTNIYKEKVTNSLESTDLIYKSAIDDYFSKFYKRESKVLPQLNEFLEKRRLKRNAAVKNPQHHKKIHNNSNEFYVEIETRFDSKKMDSGKKKQYIKDLINKIQKAIRTKDDPQKLSQKLGHQLTQQPSHHHKIIKFKKRVLSPLDDQLVKKLGVTADHVIHRQLDPISKVVPIREHFGPDRIASNSKDAWKKDRDFPSFLSRAKSINSAEVGELNVEYDKVSDGIPQRLQVPLNTDSVNDVLDGQAIDVGNLKLSIKDLDGTGLAIGFNQYLPESEKFVVYDGLENIFENFPEKYEQGENKKASVPDDVNDEFAKTMVSFHDIIKRSAQFDQLDRDLTQEKEINVEVLNVHNKRPNMTLQSLLGMGVMEKQKKSINVQKFFNHRKKIKVKQYLNTNAMASKHKKYKLRNVQASNRRKRDLSNIRVLTDVLPGDMMISPDQSAENIFIVSDENIFDENPAEVRLPKVAGNTATYDKTQGDNYETLPSPDDFVYRNVKMPNHYEDNHKNDHYEERKPEHHTECAHDYGRNHENENPHIFDHDQVRAEERDHEQTPELPLYHIQGDLSKNDPILSNYPHIVANKAEDNAIPNSNIMFDLQETIEPYDPKKIEVKLAPAQNEHNIAKTLEPDRSPDLEELTNALAPKTSYKVTVKLLPKNDSKNDGTGVKEVFTTINKTFNKNGLIYSRLVNVSEIAKIESFNETAPTPTHDIAHDTILEQNHHNNILNSKIKKSEKDLAALKKERQILKDIINLNNDRNIALNNARIAFNNSVEKKRSINDFLSIAHIPQNNREQTTKESLIITTTLTPLKPIKATSKIESSKLETKMTNAILAKIEENTIALKTFLQRLNKLEEKPKPPHSYIGSNTFMSMPSPHALQPPLVMPPIPNVDSHRNGTFIPFVYAFEQPIPQTISNQTDHMASVVYHGHIHTKTGPKLKHYDKLNSQKHNKRNALRSRFFLDDVGTLIGTPMNVFKYKNYIQNPKIKINSTILI